MSGDRESLRELADKCRSLAKGVSTPGLAETLAEMANDYERKAEKAAPLQAPAAAIVPNTPAR
jgi:hypothetical protein